LKGMGPNKVLGRLQSFDDRRQVYSLAATC
jgi:hypothetical protein